MSAYDPGNATGAPISPDNRPVNEFVERAVLSRREGGMVWLGPFRVTSNMSTGVPLNWTASGRLLLGHLPEEARLRAFTTATARPIDHRHGGRGPAATGPAKRGRFHRPPVGADEPVGRSRLLTGRARLRHGMGASVPARPDEKGTRSAIPGLPPQL